MVGAEEEETGEDEEDGGNLGIEDQIEEMTHQPPPAPVEEVVVNSPFADAAGAADIATATTNSDTSLPPFSTYSVAQLSAWLASTIKNIPQSVLTEVENNEIDGSTAIELEAEGWKDLGLTELQRAKVIAEIKKLLLKDDGS